MFAHNTGKHTLYNSEGDDVRMLRYAKEIGVVITISSDQSIHWLNHKGKEKKFECARNNQHGRFSLLIKQLNNTSSLIQRNCIEEKDEL